MNWLGSSTASHSTPWMPDTPATSTSRQQLVQAVAEFVEDRDHLVVRERRRLAVDRRGQVAGEVGDRMLDVRARAPAVDRVVHPRAALLAFARVQVEIELADQRAVAIDDVEEAHASDATSAALRLADRDAVDRLDHAEEARRAPGPRESTGALPARKTRSASPSAAPTRTRGPTARARRGRGRRARTPRARRNRARRTAWRGGARSRRKASTSSASLRHLRHQRELGVVRVAEQLARPRGAARGCARSPRCCPTRDRRRARRRAST